MSEVTAEPIVEYAGKDAAKFLRLLIASVGRIHPDVGQYLSIETDRGCSLYASATVTLRAGAPKVLHEAIYIYTLGWVDSQL